MPGQLHEVAGSHPVRTVDERALRAYLSSRPPCAYDGCDRRATLAGDACNGAHARGVETKGTKLPGATCRKIAAGKKGKPRPDMSGRMPGHAGADREAKYRWNVALVEGRARISTPEAAARMRRRAKGKLGGLLAARERGTGASTVEERLARTEEGKAALVAFRELRKQHPGWGRPALLAHLAHTGLTDSQVRALLD